MLKIDKALKEVWMWKDKIYQETKHLTMEERIAYIRKGAKEFKESNGAKTRESKKRAP